ncbi:MAG TPA: NAD-dependent epimerase/dehydratase family protein [Gemmatimonadaceae bacterium]|nr:NAD-dependent epimerase/dehydratase family protein [Gemmatimonadaceae bacterium]
MNVLLFGATGMIGQGVLRECHRDPGIARVLAVGRSPSGQRHEKLRDLVVPDLTKLSEHSDELAGFDACFFSLGVTAMGLTEAQYSRVTYDLTLAVAKALVQINPRLTFIYVSGQGTDSTERGRSMWARVKGRTENALLALSPTTYMFRPGMIIPLDGIRSRTGWYNAIYAIATPVYPVLKRFFPGYVTDTERLGRAMISVARNGASKRLFETSDINETGRA